MGIRTLVTVISLVVVATQVTGWPSKVVLGDAESEVVVVALEDSLPATQCPRIVNGLQTVLQSASETLDRVTRGRSRFTNVVVLVPGSWSTEACSQTLEGPLDHATGETWTTGDLRVTRDPHPTHGPGPYTLQTQGCGQRGDYISLSQDFLTQNYTNFKAPSGRLLARSWLQYEYGVFSESGELGNPIHPPHYLSSDGSWAPTTCADLTLPPSAAQCHPGNLSCSYAFPGGLDPGLKSSFLAFTEIETVSELCDEGSHDRDAPTRHNLLCGGQSAWEVIRASPGFVNSRDVEGGLRQKTVSFRYVQAKKPRIIFLVDDTNIMEVQERWDLMRKSVRKVVTYDIPDGYSVGVVVFDSASNTRHPLTPLSSSNRDKIGSSLPRYPSLVGEEDRCVLCGIEEAVDLLLEGGAGGHVVLVAGSSTSLTHTETEEATRLLSQARVTLHTIIYPFTGNYPQLNGGLAKLATQSGGKSFIVPDDGISMESKLSMYYNLLDSFYHTLSSLSSRDALPVKIHMARHPGGRMMMSEGSFVVDSGLGTDTVFTIFCYNIKHVGNVIHLVSPQNQVIDTTNMQTEVGDMNMIVVRLLSAQITPGLWRYKVDNKANSHQTLFVQVTSRPRPHPDIPKISIRAWTSSHQGIFNNSNISKPPALYCEVTAGMVGVEEANVTATITRLGHTINGTPYKDTTILLLDNGLTSPDMVYGDGVYSRHILGLEAGQYSIRVQVEGQVEGQVDGQVKVEQFTRHVKVGLVSMEGALPRYDIVPPARIVDLQVSLLPNTTNQVGFMWTAPGGDLDYGRADRYVVIMAANQRTLREHGGTIMEDWPTPQTSFTKQNHTLTWQKYDTVTYLALYAADEDGNIGELSNIVALYVPSPATTSSPAYSNPPSMNTTVIVEGDEESIMATFDNRQLVVIIGCFGGILIVIIAIICYCTISHCFQRKSAIKSVQKPNESAYSIAVPVAPQECINDHKPLKEGTKTHKSSSESWSASQLLSGHQDKHLTISGPSDNNSDHSSYTKKSLGKSGPVEHNGDNQYPYYHPTNTDYIPPSSDGYLTPTEDYLTQIGGYSNEGYAVTMEAQTASPHPTESLLSVSCDLPASSGPPGYQVYPANDPSPLSIKVPPPIPPKPKVLYTTEANTYGVTILDPHSATPSLMSEKRVRNVTMV